MNAAENKSADKHPRCKACVEGSHPATKDGQAEKRYIHAMLDDTNLDGRP
jgi:hypothetical protein